MIDAMDGLNELDSFGHVKSSPLGDWDGKKIEVLNQESSLDCVRLETHQRDGFSLKNHEIEPRMMRVGVEHTKKNGEKIKVEAEIDTRKPNPPQPPQPERPKNSLKV
jgi:hypothetical protein